MRILFAWLGPEDASNAEAANDGKTTALSRALRSKDLGVERVILLNNLPADRASRYCRWVESERPVEIREAPLSRPVDYGEIHKQARDAIDATRKEHGSRAQLYFFLNSGTQAMGAVWLLLGKSQYKATLLAWDTFKKKVVEVNVPFEINADFVPELLRSTDEALRDASGEKAPVAAAFASIAHRCEAMKDAIRRAQRVAIHNVPVLIEGETGTGKELFARAIHEASPRREKPYVAVNCGAIPENLVESELFGHVKGAFTDARRARPGRFRQADGGTLFLDEVGELPLAVQVKLLRPLEKYEVQPVGDDRAYPVDVRIVAATHRNLVGRISTGEFREDLFYRLAVAVLRLPPLREREGDLPVVVKRILDDINKYNDERLHIAARTLSPGAMARLKAHDWPGNVRELANTMRRAVVWSENPVVGAREIEEALLQRPPGQDNENVLDRRLGGEFRLDHLLDEVQQAYIERALKMSNGKKNAAARLLGLNSHQVLSNRIERLGHGRST